ncbi:MAG: hypothetical protein JNL74_11420 [Fibrobacteres bacterium]|nr:hypothetical protein [Fibrobacterota bacterium]
MKKLLAILFSVSSVIYCQSVATPFPGTTVYPYDFDHNTAVPQAAGSIYKPDMGTHKDSSHWGWKCTVTNGPSLAFGGNLLMGSDARLHTRVLQGAIWTRIDSSLRAVNPLQPHFNETWLLRERLKDALARARYIFFQGYPSATEASLLADSVNPELASVATALTALASSLNSKTGLQSYEDGQAKLAAAKLNTAASQISSLGSDVTAAELTTLRSTQIEIEKASEMLDAEPSPRALSMIAYDSVSKLFVVFGGDHFDYVTNDLWVFDPAIPKWMQRHPALSPSPRADHHFLPAANGTILMKGGFNVANGYKHVGPAEWSYNPTTNAWTSLTGASPVSSDMREYRNSPNTPEYLMQGAKPNAATNEALLATIPSNTWYNMNPPYRMAGGRDWGTMAYDPDRDMVYIYAGGHSTYSGTDVIHYHLSTNRYEQNNPPEMPLGWYGISEGCNGWTFNLRPWMSGHSWNGYEYHPVLKKMLLIGRQNNCCGAPRDNFMYIYNPIRGEWDGRVDMGVAPNNVYSVNPVYTTTMGMIYWHGSEFWKLNDTTMKWTKLAITGSRVPGTSVDFSGITYDSKRNKILVFSCEGYNKPFPGTVYSLDLATNVMTMITPTNAGSVSMIGPYLREVVYLPNEDKFLFIGKVTNGSTSGSPVFDPKTNLWNTANVAGTVAFNYASGLIYDKKRNLIWHLCGQNDGNLVPGHVNVLKLDSNTLVYTPFANSSSAEIAGSNIKLSITTSPNPTASTTHIHINGLNNLTVKSLAVYDIRGRLIRDFTSVLNASRTAGMAVIPWNTNGLSNEFYTIRLNAGNRILTTKVQMVK